MFLSDRKFQMNFSMIHKYFKAHLPRKIFSGGDLSIHSSQIQILGISWVFSISTVQFLSLNNTKLALTILSMSVSYSLNTFKDDYNKFLSLLIITHHHHRRLVDYDLRFLSTISQLHVYMFRDEKLSQKFIPNSITSNIATAKKSCQNVNKRMYCVKFLWNSFYGWLNFNLGRKNNFSFSSNVLNFMINFKAKYWTFLNQIALVSKLIVTRGLWSEILNSLFLLWSFHFHFVYH
jgi:hypothetical protein